MNDRRIPVALDHDEAHPRRERKFHIVARLYTVREIQIGQSEIKAAQAAGDPDLGDSYYEHWLACLERLLAEKGILSAEGLVARKEAWRKAAAATPHGQPILLPDA